MLKHLLAIAACCIPLQAHALANCTQADVAGKGTLYISGFDATSQTGFSATCAVNVVARGVLGYGSACMFGGSQYNGQIIGRILLQNAGLCTFNASFSNPPTSNFLPYTGVIAGQFTMNQSKDTGLGIGSLVGSNASGAAYGGINASMQWVKRP